MKTDQTTCIISTNGRIMAETRWTACLVVVWGIGIGNKILLNKNEMTIGRARDVDLRLAEAGVSRRHAVIQRRNELEFLLIDTDSTNGTLINSGRIKEAVLKDQDLITIGANRLKFIAADSPEQPYYEELYRQAQMDKALQVYNKHYFLTKLDEEMMRCKRYGLPLSLILLDADHFKRLNDAYGHLAGDAALMQLAETIKKRIRDTDVLCRYGGEEFTIIMPQTHQQHAYVLAEHIRILVAKAPVNHDNTVIDMTISLGISSYSGHEEQACTRELLIAQADKALYEAKHSGRNKVMLFNPTLS